MYVTALVWGPADAETIASELDAIDTDDAPYLEALISIVRGEVQRLDGDFNECRGLMQSGIEQLQTMGIHTIPAAAQSYLAWAELYGGAPASALPGLLRADSTLARFGERGFRSTVQATLAGVYERIGEYERARGAVTLADELAATDDSLTVALASAAHARLALLDKDPDAAERWARHGVEHAYRTDIPILRGTAQLELGRVLADLGRRNDARAAVNSSLELLQTKGDQPRIRYARELLAQLHAARSQAGTHDR